MSKLSSSINDVINQNRGSKPLICAYCLSSRFITWKKIFDRERDESHVRTRITSNRLLHLEIPISGEEAGMGEGGVGKVSVDATCL